ncbi:ketosteroid isomerase-like protein [Saccharothrix ecbatanensis]|uniref:Ketosteroid isomerase-like protein n=1 Tax=Saccharothrix ecbatanensis TaxID=1105145 RepID=A0A7W9HDM1_9PSEU|nr:nuclear transport factor 2 family protein [Saccharothrix ecbatanensis]MBB5800327.1 ketosteroid isomerase-like protein [Saccharothrix ecbatanensis]
MYHTIVRAKVRSLWARMADGDYQAAVGLAAPDVHFRFVGDGPPGAEFTGREAFAQWFRDVEAVLPGLRITAGDIVVKGWPWNTTVVTRFRAEATLADGTAYRNEGIQWVGLRWGRMVDDYVLEDTARLADAVRRQEQAGVKRADLPQNA